MSIADALHSTTRNRERIEDALLPIPEAELDPQSYVGRRYAGNVRRLLDVDLDARLAGFRSRPGVHPWIGEHIGKWIHAATITWGTTGDAELRRKLGDVVEELAKTQEPDGYLGTYAPELRFGSEAGSDWDVWTHKYCLIGLLTYYAYTGEELALVTARRAADLLIDTFGDDEGRQSILGAGTHMGMAATSVLEPIASLYLHSGDERYLQFADYILRAWNEPGGPRVLSTLLGSGRVSEVGNGKAYEMLSNILGLVQLARATGRQDYLDAAERAWHDVVQHHLYVTGTASFGEHFHHPDELPDSVSVNIGETCVTVTWLQLTRELFFITGEAKYASEIERTALNHLAGAQLPDGSAWCYYSPLDGYRTYDVGITCCSSSGPRGISLLPSTVFLLSPGGDSVSVAQLWSGRVRSVLDGANVSLELATPAPFQGGAVLTVDTDEPATFEIRLRRPAWARSLRVDQQETARDGDWIIIEPREYRGRELIEILFDVDAHDVHGSGWNRGRIAKAWGPLVLGYRSDAETLGFFDTISVEAPAIEIPSEQATAHWAVANPFTKDGTTGARVSPFAEIGATGQRYRVWLEEAPVVEPVSLFHGATESISSGELRRGSVSDYDTFSFAATRPDLEPDWFALELPTTARFDRVVFTHGRSMVHGGWFDTSEGRPQVQIRRTPGAEWQTIAEIESYPETTAADDGGIEAGQTFDISLSEPVEAVGIRIRGRGAFGDYPPLRFSTAARLQAFLSRRADQDR